MPLFTPRHARLALTAALTTIFATMGQADLRVTFDEGAPKDRFYVENASACAITGSSILIDLSTSAAGLIFDVTDQGAGVEVFQPFELIEGEASLASVPSVTDGEARVTLDVASLASGASIVFSIDVDDTLGQRAITVSGSEIEGARVALSHDGHTTDAAFSSSARALVSVAGC